MFKYHEYKRAILCKYIYLPVCLHINYLSLYIWKKVYIYIINLFINSMCRIPGKGCRTELSRYFIYTWEPGIQPIQGIQGKSCRTELDLELVLFTYFFVTSFFNPISYVTSLCIIVELSKFD